MELSNGLLSTADGFHTNHAAISLSFKGCERPGSNCLSFVFVVNMGGDLGNGFRKDQILDVGVHFEILFVIFYSKMLENFIKNQLLVHY